MGEVLDSLDSFAQCTRSEEVTERLGVHASRVVLSYHAWGSFSVGRPRR